MAEWALPETRSTPRSAEHDNTAVKEVWRQDDMKNMQQRVRVLEEQIEELRAQINQQGTRGDTRQLHADLDKSRKSVKELKRQLLNSETELNETRRQVHALCKQSTVDQRKIKDLEEKEQQLVKQMKNMAEQLSKKEAAMIQMKKQMENMQKEIKNSQKELKNTKQDLSITKEELKKTKEELENTKHEVKMNFQTLAERLKMMEEKAEARDAREHAPCTDAGSDVNANGTGSPSRRQPTSSLTLPPIIGLMNFPPHK